MAFVFEKGELEADTGTEWLFSIPTYGHETSCSREIVNQVAPVVVKNHPGVPDCGRGLDYQPLGAVLAVRVQAGPVGMVLIISSSMDLRVLVKSWWLAPVRSCDPGVPGSDARFSAWGWQTTTGMLVDTKSL